MDDPVREITGVIETLCTAPPAAQRAAIETYFTPTASFTHPFCRTGSFAGSIWLIMMIYRWYKILSPEVQVEVESIGFDEENLRLYVSVHQHFVIQAVPFYHASVRLVTVLQLTTDPIPAGQYEGQELEREATQALPATRSAHSDEDNGWKTAGFSAKNGKNKSGRGRTTASNSRPSKESAGDEEPDKYYIQSQNDLYQTSEFIKFVVPWGIGVLLVVLFQYWATFLCVLGTKTYDIATWIPRTAVAGFYQAANSHSKKSSGAD